MKVKEISFSDYGYENILVLTPKNFKWNRGATFPPDSLDCVLRIYGECGLAEENSVSLDEDNHTLTIRISEEVYPYNTVKK